MAADGLGRRDSSVMQLLGLSLNSDSLAKQQQQQLLLQSQDDDMASSKDAIPDSVLQLGQKVHRLMSIIQDEEFRTKYGWDFRHFQSIQYYCFVETLRTNLYCIEAFASVQKMQVTDSEDKKDELVYHPMFEEVIGRYTRTRAKPNPILVATRSSDFCYQLTIRIEAIPQDEVNQYNTLRLVREYQILSHIWETFQAELYDNKSSSDQLVGIPMPFEFCSVAVSEYDFQSPEKAMFFDIRGEISSVKHARTLSGKSLIKSSLSYLSMEKLGPSVSYLLELLKSQGQMMSVASALKIYDQLLCRLIVLHKYGIVTGSLDLKTLQFGCREASNVLYISNYDCAVVTPTQQPTPQFANQRFSSMRVAKRQACHFVQDLESAFYIFLALLRPLLPWDSDLNSAGSSVSALEHKEKFWRSKFYINRIVDKIVYDYKDQAPINFSIETIRSLYYKNCEALSPGSAISHADMQGAAMTNSTSGIYMNIRKVLVSYFRFESINTALKDPICTRRIDMLCEASQRDERKCWDLNMWCWNMFEPAEASSGDKRNKFGSFAAQQLRTNDSVRKL